MGGKQPLHCEDIGKYRCGGTSDAAIGVHTAGQRCTCARRLLVKQGAQGDAAYGAAEVDIAGRLQPGRWDDDRSRLSADDFSTERHSM